MCAMQSLQASLQATTPSAVAFQGFGFVLFCRLAIYTGLGILEKSGSGHGEKNDASRASICT